MKTYKQFLMEAAGTAPNHEAMESEHHSKSQDHSEKQKEYEGSAEYDGHTSSERKLFTHIARAHEKASDMHHYARIAHGRAKTNPSEYAKSAKQFGDHANDLSVRASKLEAQDPYKGKWS